MMMRKIIQRTGWERGITATGAAVTIYGTMASTAFVGTLGLATLPAIGAGVIVFGASAALGAGFSYGGNELKK